MRMKDMYIDAYDLVVMMVDGEITLDDAIDEMTDKYSFLSRLEAESVIDSVMDEENV